MIVAVEISRAQRPPSAPPPEMFWAYRSHCRYSDVYAMFPTNLVLRAWHHRWLVVDALIRVGILTVGEGDYYRNARFSSLSCWFRGR